MQGIDIIESSMSFEEDNHVQNNGVKGGSGALQMKMVKA